MYGIFTYIWVIYGPNVAKYTIHGSSGIYRYISKCSIDHHHTTTNNANNPKLHRRQTTGNLNSFFIT